MYRKRKLIKKKNAWEDRYKKLIYSGDLEKAKELLLDTFPSGTDVYKYTRGTKQQWDTIKNRKLWLSSVRNLNDPFDSAFLTNCRSKERYQQYERKKAMKEAELQIRQDKISEDLRDSVFVASFSRRCDSLVMWSHYGDEHRGICFAYDLHTLIEKYNFFPVIYSDELPQIQNRDFKKEEMKYKFILTKCSEWKYENEWRIVCVDDSKSSVKGFEIDFEEPKAIYLGAMQRETEKLNSNIKEMEKKYVNDNECCRVAKKKKIMLYDYDLNRGEFSLFPRVVL